MATPDIIADLDHLDALWAAEALNEDDFLNALPWEAISKVLRASVVVMDSMTSCEHYHSGEQHLADALDELGK